MKKAEVIRYTGGSIYWYPGFNSNVSGDEARFSRDLSAYLTKKVGFEAVMRVRASPGIKIEEFYGNLILKTINTVVLPCINHENAYTFNAYLDDTLDYRLACVQVSTIFTGLKGDRRIRVMTLPLAVVNNIMQVYNFADQYAVAASLTKAGKWQVIFLAILTRTVYHTSD